MEKSDIHGWAAIMVITSLSSQSKINERVGGVAQW
jgi:hypothetical protein